VEPAGRDASEPAALTPSQEDYLKTIYSLGELDEAVTVTRIAQWLGVKQPSASVMVKRLTDDGLVVRDEHSAVGLSDTGLAGALALVRKHRIIETYLHRRLGFGWDEVHDEAERLEHGASDLLIDRMEAELGHPERDPHGDPIPNAQGELPVLDERPLASVDDGVDVVVVRVRDRSSSVLVHLDEMGLVPGTHLTITERDPFGGALHVRTADGERILGPMLIDAIAVR